MRGVPQRCSVVIRRRAELSYLLYEPARARNRRARVPLMLFLHGMGERGNNLEAVTLHGPPKLAEAGRDFPFLLAAPQCPATTTWHAELEALRALVRQLVQRHRVDTARIFLTGLSMGGFGTWHLAVENPHAFAAAAPICGGAVMGTGLASRMAEIRHLPVWAFHGARDDVVPLGASQELVDALRAAGGNARLTVYPEAGHDSWTAAYDDPKLYEWLLAQRNPAFRLPG